jgi:hypothetical protein
MAGKNTAAFGIFANRPLVENAVDRLRSAGYRNTGYFRSVSRQRRAQRISP